MSSRLFGTDGIRGGANQYPIDPATILKIGMAIGKAGLNVLIAKDTRISCYMLESALTSGLISVGANVHLLGPLPSASLALLTKQTNSDIGLMISASHNPHYDNGIKLFNHLGDKLPVSQQKEIENEFQKDLSDKMTDASSLGKVSRIYDAQSKYIEFVKSTFPFDLQGMKIVLDCANGAAYQVAPKIFEILKAEVIPLNVKPDGVNINHNCGALYPEVIRASVLDHKADLGISLDGDADRVILCDEMANIIDGERILATIAEIQLQNKSSKVVVSTTMASMSFEEHLKKVGIGLLRSDVGDQNVVSTMKENDCSLGGEPSGHIILGEYINTSDGILAALQMISAMVTRGKKMSEVCSSFYRKPLVLQSVQHNNQCVNLQSLNIQSLLQDANARLGKYGRMIIRKSGTEPVIRILAEGDDMNEVNNVMNEAVKLISKISS